MNYSRFLDLLDGFYYRFSILASNQRGIQEIIKRKLPIYLIFKMLTLNYSPNIFCFFLMRKLIVKNPTRHIIYFIIIIYYNFKYLATYFKIFHKVFVNNKLQRGVIIPIIFRRFFQIFKSFIE